MFYQISGQKESVFITQASGKLKCVMHQEKRVLIISFADQVKFPAALGTKEVFFLSIFFLKNEVFLRLKEYLMANFTKLS